MVLIKHNNKTLGYKCDKTKMVPKVIYSDEDSFLCEAEAVKKYGADVVAKAELDN